MCLDISMSDKLYKYMLRGSSPRVVANLLVYIIVVSEIELQQYYCIHLQTNTLLKGENSFIPMIIG